MTEQDDYFHERWSYYIQRGFHHTLATRWAKEDVEDRFDEPHMA